MTGSTFVWRWLAALMTVTLVLVACAPAAQPQAPSAPAAQPQAPVEKVKLRLGTWAGAGEAKELQDLVLSKVNAAAKDYEIVSEPVPADYYTKLQTTLAGGAGPDLFWLSQEFIAGYADKGALLDITERLKSDGRAAAKLDDYYPPVFQTVKLNNKVYGLPWISQPVMLYYNPKLFQDAGVKEPDESWTWDDFTVAAEKLTIPGKQWGTTFNSWPPIQMFIWQAGGEVITSDLCKSPIDSPEAIKGAKFYQSIIYNEKRAVPEKVISEQGFSEMAKAGKVAMFFGGAADDLDYAYKKDPKVVQLKTALVPKGPRGRTTFAWSAATVINGQTKYPQQAYNALVDLTEGIHQWKVLAPRKSLAKEDVIAASVPDKKDAATLILKAAPDMRSFTIIPRQQEWDTIFWEQFQDPLFHNKGTAEELAAKARKSLEAVLPKKC